VTKGGLLKLLLDAWVGRVIFSCLCILYGIPGICFCGGKNQFPRSWKSISMVVKIKFIHLWHTQTSVLATRARVTLSFDWSAFAVKLFFWQFFPGKLRAYLIGWCMVRFGTCTV